MKAITVEAKVENLEEVLAFLDEFLDQTECKPKGRMQLAIALEEIFVNIAHYAYIDTDVPEKERTTKIEMEMMESTSKPRVVISLEDSGICYNPLEKTDPDVTLSADERQIGGLGIFMVKKSMDKVFYERRDGKNIFTMEKEI